MGSRGAGRVQNAPRRRLAVASVASPNGVLQRFNHTTKRSFAVSSSFGLKSFRVRRMFVCMSVSIYLSIYLSIYIFIYLFIYLYGQALRGPRLPPPPAPPWYMVQDAPPCGVGCGVPLPLGWLWGCKLLGWGSRVQG